MKLHVIAPFHTKLTPAFSHCAFTSRALGFVNMMSAPDIGYEVIEYSNEGSTSSATEHVEMLNAEEFAEYFPPIAGKDFHDKNSTLGSDGWKRFDERLRTSLAVRATSEDLILHTFGRAHRGVVHAFPNVTHVEPFVGYPDAPIGAYRIFESEAWRHYDLGRFENMRDPFDGTLMYPRNPGLMRNYSFVVPNARDASEWPVGEGLGNYCLFMGRIHEVKGTDRIAEMIRRWDALHPHDGLKFVFAGQGDFDRVASQTMRGNVGLAKRLDFVGHVTGTDRAELVGNARLMLCPTQYVEPGGGSAIESMLCGTPVLASAWGCYTETVLHGLTGYQCRTMADWIAGIEYAPKLSRRTIAEVARQRFSFEAAAPAYKRIFEQFRMLLADDESTSLVIP